MSKLFPEIDARPPPVESGGRRARGSAWSRDALARMLGLPGPFGGDPSAAVTEVETDLEGGAVEVTVEGGGLPRTTLRLVPRRPTRRGGPDIAVELAGEPSADSVRALMRHVERRLSSTRHRQLRNFLRLDPRRQIHGRRDPLSAEQDAVFQRSVVRTYRSPVAWREFFADVEQRRNFTHHLSGRVVFVDHADLECVGATPRIADGAVSFFRYAAVHHRRTRAGGGFPHLGAVPQDVARFVADASGSYATDLDDAAVIGGGCDRLEQVLRHVAALPREPDLVLLRNSCVPVVIGDDLEGIARAFEQRSGIPTVTLDKLADQHNSQLSSLLQRQQRTQGFEAAESTAGRLNLVGFPRSEEMRQLTELLPRMGLVINTELVPDVPLESIPRTAHAALQVLLDAQLFDTTFEQLFGNVDISSLRPPPPFGVAASEAWLRAIAAAMGVADRVDAVWSEAWAGHAPQWDELREQARGHCLGFVVDGARLAALCAPRQLTGARVLDAVEEMGFEIELLCYGDAGEAEAARRGWRIAAFDSPGELAVALRDGRAEAVYSEYVFDRRLTRNGVAAFSVADFAPGPAGAVRTLRTLLRRCRLPFYRKYSALLEGDR